MNIEQKLDTLAEFQAQADYLALTKQAEIDKVMTPTIRQAIDDIEAEFASRAEAVQANIAALTEEIKQDVLAGGATVKGAHFMAVWNKGRVSWDSKLLEGLMIAVPELAKARKEGEPSVSIRKV